ncbi:uncharacterized protein AMSG_05834 [Thecamonas trahens ATCC 50062]|uniref:Uncharacterized protein n=1 Tax=Thecamonas trahens ATCC 50062 TaxID=461836 RepID=A0A0L0DCZ9_THETB|nr:hypothetical protein AMSG_05834 [Thecamonas trahens ATCC 50062]KNC50070.1 hypothetical protein AMSG_05834 [Thecamonas trahens ATCC 50062]|eukprot:XP_013757234.1 hypothetical protein AMSG_05834 [Thecamonas trahens ATCC 50062]
MPLARPTTLSPPKVPVSPPRRLLTPPPPWRSPPPRSPPMLPSEIRHWYAGEEATPSPPHAPLLPLSPLFRERAEELEMSPLRDQPRPASPLSWLASPGAAMRPKRTSRATGPRLSDAVPLPAALSASGLAPSASADGCADSRADAGAGADLVSDGSRTYVLGDGTGEAVLERLARRSFAPQPHVTDPRYSERNSLAQQLASRAPPPPDAQLAAHLAQRHRCGSYNWILPTPPRIPTPTLPERSTATPVYSGRAAVIVPPRPPPSRRLPGQPPISLLPPRRRLPGTVARITQLPTDIHLSLDFEATAHSSPIATTMAAASEGSDLLRTRLSDIVHMLIAEFPYRNVLRTYTVPTEKQPVWLSTASSSAQQAEVETHLRNVALARLEAVVLATLEGTEWVAVDGEGVTGGRRARQSADGDGDDDVVVVERAGEMDEATSDAVVGAASPAVPRLAPGSRWVLEDVAELVAESKFVRGSLAAAVTVMTGVLPGLIVASCSSKADVAAVSVTSVAALGLYLGGLVTGPVALGSTAAVAAYRSLTWSQRVVAQAKASVEAQLAASLANRRAIADAFAAAFLDELRSDPDRFNRLALLIVKRQKRLADERAAAAAMPALSDSWLVVDHDEAEPAAATATTLSGHAVPPQSPSDAIPLDAVLSGGQASAPMAVSISVLEHADRLAPNVRQPVPERVPDRAQ